MQEINPNQQKYTRGKGAPCAGGWVVRGSDLINLKKSTAEGFGSCRHCEGVPTYCRAARGGRRREGGAAPGSGARLGGRTGAATTSYHAHVPPHSSSWGGRREGGAALGSGARLGEGRPAPRRPCASARAPPCSSSWGRTSGGCCGAEIGDASWG